MARRCTVCAHPERAAVDGALIERQPFRHIAARFGLTPSALVRHHDDHLPAAMVQAARIGEVTRADDLIDRLLALARETQAILDRAKETNNDDLALKAIARAEKQLELQARLIGELKDAPTINIVMSPAWVAIQNAVVVALDPWPEARLAVTTALEHAHFADAAS